MKRLTIMMIALVAMTTACAGNVFSLEVGQCFNDPDEFDEVSSVETVDCSESHDNEVYHLFDLPDGDYPGRLTAQDLADTGCEAAFESYVNRDYPSSAYVISTLVPSSDSWESSAKDREVVCFLFDLTLEPTTGSARNSGL